MNSRMVVRVLSISMALLFFGMVVPSLSDASVATAGGVDLGQVLINSSPSSTTFGIQNQDDQITITLYFNLSGTCGFSYDTTLQGKPLGPQDVVNMTVTYAPTDIGVCSDTLTVYYLAGGVLNSVEVVLTGEGVAELGPSTVIIDGHDTGVENGLYNEKPMSEYLETCSENAKNHGQYVRCVALMTRKMRRAKVLTKEERRAIMKAAAHANIPPIEAGLEGLVYDGKPVVEWIDECKESAKNKKQYMRCVRKLMKEMKKEGVTTTRRERHQMRRYAAYLKFRSWHHED